MWLLELVRNDDIGVVEIVTFFVNADEQVGRYCEDDVCPVEVVAES